jgi:hypothetical protein
VLAAEQQINVEPCFSQESPSFSTRPAPLTPTPRGRSSTTRSSERGGGRSPTTVTLDRKADLLLAGVQAASSKDERTRHL